MILQSKPHTIEGFKFDPEKIRDAPKWFHHAYEIGKLIVTINQKTQCILIHNKRGELRAHAGDWVCINDAGTLFVLSDEEIANGFTVLT